ncbi:MAG TPA: DUF4129 domain-containing protein [Candidatus Angelobacter sp.]
MRINPHISRFCLCLLAVLLFFGTAQAGISPSEYRRQLQQFSQRVEQLKDHPEQVGDLIAGVPDKVPVIVDSQEYSLSYDWLKTGLKKFRQADPKTRPGLLPPIEQRLQSLEQQAQAFESSPAASQQNHAKVEEILSRREFRKTHRPGFLAIWWEKLMRAISNFFDRHPIYGYSSLKLIIYLIVATAFIMFAIWVSRRFRLPTEDLPRQIMPFAPSAKGWRTWLAEAQASAQQGHWREGIHLAYWAAISFLEEQGAWRPDRARTPREYLRMLGARKPQYPALSALTRKFEVVWYGHWNATAADFQETVGQLEKLGCR